MVDDILLNKAAILEHCLIRIREEYADHEPKIETDLTRQDSIIGRPNTECATWCENALKEVVARKPEVIFLGSSSTYDFRQTQWLVATSRVLQTPSPASGHLYVPRATPDLPFDGPGNLSARN